MIFRDRTDESKVDTLLTKISGDTSLSSACSSGATLNSQVISQRQFNTYQMRCKQEIVWSIRIIQDLSQLRPQEETANGTETTMEEMVRLLAKESQIQSIVILKRVIYSLTMALILITYGGTC